MYNIYPNTNLLNMRNHKTYILLLITIITSTAFSQEQAHWSAARPDGHAPISVMGDHTHHKNEVMFSYKYMPMWMEGSLSGRNAASDGTIFENYMAAPKKMHMEMHMLGAMYATSNNITLMVMVHYLSNSMDLKTKMGMDFGTQSKGFGDISIAALFNLLKLTDQSVHAMLGVSIPTGDIDQRGDTPMMANAQLAYSMQLGSGTWDPILGVTYLGQSDKFSWGAQLKQMLRLGENSETYRLGNQFRAGSWAAIKLNKNFSFSGSLRYTNLSRIKGADKDMNPGMMPLFNTENSGRNQTDAGIGINFYIPKGSLKNLRFASELLLPVTQSVNGIQMKNTSLATFGVQYTL